VRREASEGEEESAIEIEKRETSEERCTRFVKQL